MVDFSISVTSRYSTRSHGADTKSYVYKKAKHKRVRNERKQGGLIESNACLSWDVAADIDAQRGSAGVRATGQLQLNVPKSRNQEGDLLGLKGAQFA